MGVLRKRGEGLPPWAGDEAVVGQLSRGSLPLLQCQFVAWLAGGFAAIGVLGAAGSGGWEGLLAALVLIVLLGPVVWAAYLVSRWQWSSIEVLEGEVLVCNPTAAHVFELDALLIRDSPRLVQRRLRIGDGKGRFVWCFGLGTFGWPWPNGRLDDFRVVVEASQLQGGGERSSDR